MSVYREPTSNEISTISSKLKKLNETFYVWSEYHHDPRHLLEFAYYEGCNEPIMAEVAPYVVGETLVNKYSFKWVMIQSGDFWHYGVIHPLFEQPIDLIELKNGEWYRPEPDDEPEDNGRTTFLSLDIIILALKWRQLKGYGASIPNGSLSKLEQEVARASALSLPSKNMPVIFFGIELTEETISRSILNFSTKELEEANPLLAKMLWSEGLPSTSSRLISFLGLREPFINGWTEDDLYQILTALEHIVFSENFPSKEVIKDLQKANIPMLISKKILSLHPISHAGLAEIALRVVSRLLVALDSD